MNPDLPAFDPKAVKLAAAYDTPGTLFAVCLDERNKTLYGAGSDGALYAVDLAGEKPAAVRKEVLHDNYVASLILREGVLISAGYDRRLTWFDLEAGKRLRVVPAHDGWVRKLVLSPDGTRVVSVGDDMLVKVWDAEGKLVAALSGHAAQTPEGYLSALYAVTMSADGKHVASADRAGWVRIWDLAARKTAATFRAADLYTFDAQKRARAIGGVRGLAFSPDGTKLAVSGIGPVTNVDGFVGPCQMEIWDWRKSDRLAVGQAKHQAILNQVAFSPRSPWLIGAGGGDGGGALCFWDANGTVPPHVLQPKGHLHSFALNAAGTRLYAAGHGGFEEWRLG
jgi:WD40 repeat protein